MCGASPRMDSGAGSVVWGGEKRDGSPQGERAGGVGGLLPGGAALWVDGKLSHVADAIGRSACPASKQGFAPLRRPKARVGGRGRRPGGPWPDPNHLPSGRFAANGAWLAVQTMAHNLARWTARIGLGERIATTKTLRRRFFSLAGRLTRSARRLTLHLPDRWPWAEKFSRAMARLRAIPLPA